MDKDGPKSSRPADAAFISIEVEVIDRIGWLTLNRPERRNALSPDMLDEIVSCLRSWSQGTSVSVVVIGGHGPAFCSGLDRDWIGSYSEDDRRALQFASSAFHRELFGLRIPTIAMIHGFAIGTGMDVAVLCDMRVASDDAIFGHPEIAHGGPPLFTPLRSVVGDGWARDLCLTGRLISAEEANRIGLLNKVVDRSQLRETTRALAEQVARSPRTALIATKSFFRVNPGLDDFIHSEHDQLFDAGLLFRDEHGAAGPR
jgi:enoyl-CoA hydratase/carnithine racemase